MEKKIAFVFPGQGVQYPGMMRDLYEEYQCVRDVFYMASDTLCLDITDICFNSSQEQLNKTVNTQISVLAADLSAAAVAREHDLIPMVSAGFSLGEYAALADSGVISIPDAFRIVKLRAEAMLRAAPEGSGMAAIIGVSKDTVYDLCRRVTCGYIAPANFNNPIQNTVAGDKEGLSAFIDLAKAEKIRCQILPVSVPSHCDLMLTASEEMKDILKDIKINNPKCGLIMNVDATPISTSDNIFEQMCKQLISPVRWVETQHALHEYGADIFIECGPGRVLCGLARRTVPEIKTLSIENMTSLRNTLNYCI